MDIVITFVDGNDPLWQQDYAQTVGPSVIAKRYRDWGLLKYLFRGIEKHLPFIRQVHLVVSRESQVPAWINPQNVHVVLHRDIIPQQFLPVFNASSIEMFLHRIPGLDEEFLYFNDDCFPVKDCRPEDFFEGNRIILGFTKHFFTGSPFKELCKMSDSLAKKAAGVEASRSYHRPQHICTPLFKSECDKVYEKMHDEVFESITPLREKKNYNQYIFSDYLFYTGRATGKKIVKKHFSLRTNSAEKIAKWLKDPQAGLVCINDVTMSEAKYLKGKEILQQAFQERFPQKSRFEK